MSDRHLEIDRAIYQQEVVALFDRRSATYDDDRDFHPPMSRRLVEAARLQWGWRVLDLATGTGQAAIAAAECVGPMGLVVGVDCSPRMLDRARAKSVGLLQVSWLLGDAQDPPFPPASFDAVLCSSAFAYFRDQLATLQRWRQLLIPGGTVAFHGWSEQSFTIGVLIRQLAAEAGYPIAFHELTRDRAACADLLQLAGFEVQSIDSERQQRSLNISSIDQSVATVLDNPICLPLRSALGSDRLATFRQQLHDKIAALLDKNGNLLDEWETFYIVGRKPRSSSLI